MLFIAGAQQSSIGGSGDINLSAPKATCDRMGNVLVEVEPEHALSPSGFCSMTVQKAGPICGAKFVHKSRVLPHLAQDFVAMVVEVGKGGVNLAQRQVRQSFNDFLGSPAVDLGLGVNVLNTNPRLGDEGP